TVGTVTDNDDGTFGYDPDGNFESLAATETAVDTFEYTAGDGNGGSDTATVTITVFGVNDAPTATDDDIGTDPGFTVGEDGPAITTPDVLANDTDPDASDVLEIEGVDTTGTVGIVTDNGDGTFEYDPDGNFEVLDDGDSDTTSFDYTARDGNGGSDVATVTITVTGVNDEPSITSPAAVNAAENQTAVVDVQSTDPEGDTEGAGLTYGITGGADQAKFSIVAATGVLTFSAAPDFETPTDAGADNVYDVQVTVTDSGALTDVQDIAVTVTDANEPPVLVNIADQSGDELTLFSFTATATDPDLPAQTLTFSLDDGLTGSVPMGAAITGGGSFTWTPSEAQGPGTYTFDVVVTDNGMPVLDDSQTFTITVEEVNVNPSDGDEGTAGAPEYSAISGVPMFVSGGTATGPTVSTSSTTNLLDNATDSDLPAQTLSAVAATGSTSPAGSGTFEVFADGTFTYSPPIGFEGVASFTYGVSDTVGSDTSTAFIDVADTVWFVDDVNGSDATGDGTFGKPFASLAPLSTGGAADAADGAGDFIYVLTDDGATAGGIVLETDQKLIGNAVDLVVGMDTLVTGVGGNGPTVNAAAGTAIDLSTGNTVRGLSVVAGAGTAIDGTAGVGTLTVNTVAAVTASGGPAVDINGGTPTVSTGTVSSTGSATGGVNIQNTAAGSYVFDGVTITTTGGTGFRAVSAGSVAVTGTTNTVASTSGLGIDISNTTIAAGGVTFASVSASGGTQGIVLSGTGSTGTFTITGDTGTTVNASGGTIQNTTGDGISLTNVSDVGFDQVRIDNADRHGIFGTLVNDFSFTNGEVLNQGDADNENAIDFSTAATANLTGTATISGTIITNFHDTGIDIANNSGSLTLTIDSSTFDDNHDMNGAEAIVIESTGTASISADVTDNSFDDIENDAVAIRAAGSGATHDLNITGNTSINGGGPDNFPGGGDLLIDVATAASVTFDVQGNEILDSPLGNGVTITGAGNAEGRIGGPLPADGNTFSGLGGSGVRIDVGNDGVGTGVRTILVQNNDIGVDNTLTAGGPFNGLGTDGIATLHRDSSGSLNITIEDNTISNITNQAIDVFTDEDIGLGGTNPTSSIRIADNTFTGLGDDAIEVDTDETANACLHIFGNSNGAAGSPGTFDLDQRGDPLTVLQITQASTAALSTDNTGATVVPTGTITFNGMCLNPTLPANS
ncbi:MAG: tandem-95 repeat protein, partial [Acidimicrobiia bacterium]|nr:tandem-95 repeat protein [Acidimicrobiia bacterium]